MSSISDVPPPLEGDLPYCDDLEHQDQIEEALCQTPLADLTKHDFVVVAPDSTVRDTLSRWHGGGDHCAVVVENEKIVGIFTERDVLCKIADDFAAHADKPIRNFMTKSPGTLEGHIPVVFGLNRMTVGGFRHIPITKDRKLSGLVSTRDFFAFMVKHLPDVSGAPAASGHSVSGQS